MKNVSSREAKKFNNSPACSVFEYTLGDSAIDMARAEIHGRYPEKGWAMNEACKEVAYVLEGSGRVNVDGWEVVLTVGDVVLIEPMEKFYWDGKMKLALSCSPAWRPEQYKMIE